VKKKIDGGENKKEKNKIGKTHTTNGIQMLRLPSGTGSKSWPMRYVVPFRLLRAKKKKNKDKKILKKKKKIKAFFQLYTIKIGGNKISPFSIFLFFVFKK
jgi:hypothetical protein